MKKQQLKSKRLVMMMIFYLKHKQIWSENKEIGEDFRQKPYELPERKKIDW